MRNLKIERREMPTTTQRNKRVVLCTISVYISLQKIHKIFAKM